MKIYRVTKREDGDAHAGYFYTLYKKEATDKQRLENDCSGVNDEVQELEVSMNKWDVVALLNQVAGHPDNG